MDKVNIILKEIKKGKSPKVVRSLDKLNKILLNYYKSGGKNFSFTNIGRLTEEADFLSTSSLRNENNTHYRVLIEAYAKKSRPDGSIKKNRSLIWDYLNKIDDINTRQHFASYIAENELFRREFKAYKQKVDLYELNVIDLRSDIKEDSVDANSLAFDCLLEEEISTLEYSISQKCLRKNNWEINEIGQILSTDSKKVILPRGFAFAIKKILNILESYDE